jgi:hypothetical protein
MTAGTIHTDLSAPSAHDVGVVVTFGSKIAPGSSTPTDSDTRLSSLHDPQLPIVNDIRRAPVELPYGWFLEVLLLAGLYKD